jgi:predicted  nucleic acid-binding Zn-ribbon protein
MHDSMNRKILEKISGLSSDTILIFLIIFVVVSTITVQYFYKKREGTLLKELKSAQGKEAELNLRLNDALESIHPLKKELDNLRRKIVIENTVFPSSSLAYIRGEEKISRMPMAAGANPVRQNLAEINLAPFPRRLPPLSARAPLKESSSTPRKTKTNLSRLKNYVIEIEQSNSELKKNVQGLAGLLKKKDQDFEKLNSDYAALKKDLEAVLNNQEKLRRQSDDKDRRMNELLSSKEGQINQEAQLRAASENTVRELSDKVTELTTENSSLKGELKAMAMDSDMLQAMLAGIEEELDRERGNAVVLQKKISDADQALSQKEKENQGLSEKVNELEQRMVTLSQQLSKPRKPVATGLDEKAVENLLSQLSQAKEREEANLRQIQNLRGVNSLLREKLQDALSQLELLKTENVFISEE